MSKLSILMSFRMFVFVFVLEHVYSYVCLSLWPNTCVCFCLFVIVCVIAMQIQNIFIYHLLIDWLIDWLIFFFSLVDWLIEEFIKLQIPLFVQNSSIFHLWQLSFFSDRSSQGLFDRVHNLWWNVFHLGQSDFDPQRRSGHVCLVFNMAVWLL